MKTIFLYVGNSLWFPLYLKFGFIEYKALVYTAFALVFLSYFPLAQKVDDNLIHIPL